MICRLWRGWTTPENADAYERVVRSEVIPGIEAREHRARCLRHVTGCVILTHECLDCIEAVEPHQRLKFDLTVDFALHQIDVAKAGNISRLDSGNDLTADDRFISFGILERRPAAPDAADRHTRIGIST
jgi:hypothetical protein